MVTDIRAVEAIDVHSHLGPAHGWQAMETAENGSEDYLLQTMRDANISVSINSSRFAILPRGSGYTEEGNARCFSDVQRLPGVYMWVTVDPHEARTFDQARELLQHPKVLGIKIHPEEHEYDLAQEADRLFALAASCGVPLLGHSGAACCMPEVYSLFAARYPEIPVIAAHLGSAYDGDPTHHIQAIAAHPTGNLYVDTSSVWSMLANLLEYAVRTVGADRILFGTDSSNYFSPAQRARVDYAGIDPADKRKILRENALRIFPQLRRP